MAKKPLSIAEEPLKPELYHAIRMAVTGFLDRVRICEQKAQHNRRQAEQSRKNATGDGYTAEQVLAHENQAAEFDRIAEDAEARAARWSAYVVALQRGAWPLFVDESPVDADAAGAARKAKDELIDIGRTVNVSEV